MRAYLHDGSFEGFMCCIYISFTRRDMNEGDFFETVPIFKESEFTPSLLYEDEFVETTEDGDRVISKIRRENGEDVLDEITKAFLSDDARAQRVIARFLFKLFKRRVQLDQMNDEDAYGVFSLSRRVTRETHRMLGLVRFAEIQGGVYYSRIEPDCNVLPLISEHFRDRMGSHPWVIHDVRRGYAVFYDTHRCYMADVDNDAMNASYSNTEDWYSCLWKEYFKAIAIRERISLKRQAGMMPKKYWKNLTEKK